MIAFLVAALMRLAHSRFVRIFLEQPKDSMLPMFPPMKRAIAVCNLAQIMTFLGAFGCELQKPLRIWSDARFLTMLRRRRPASRGPGLCYTVNAVGAVSGGPGLAGTAAYTRDFADTAGAPASPRNSQSPDSLVDQSFARGWVCRSLTQSVGWSAGQTACGLASHAVCWLCCRQM